MMCNQFLTSSFSDLVNGKLRNVLSGAKKIVFISHGYWAGTSYGCDYDWQSKMASNIRRAEGQDVVTAVLCWNSDLLETFAGGRSLESGSAKKSRYDLIPSADLFCQLDYAGGGPYYKCASSTAKLGEMLAGLMKVIKADTSISYFHGIGHSLGAHIMGNVFNFGGFKMDRISGLDPAGPCFNGLSGEISIYKGSKYNLWGLTKRAADFVDNYHTDGDHFGTLKSKGHLDLFAGMKLSRKGPTIFPGKITSKSKLKD